MRLPRIDGQVLRASKRKEANEVTDPKTKSWESELHPEYKAQSLHAWRLSGRSAAKVGAELGIRPALLYEWAKVERRQAQQGVPPLHEEEHNRELRERVQELEEENAKLLEQREVLKKSLGILSEAPPRSMPASKR